MKERFFCAIPARGGSERLLRKNILPLAGKPMIAYTILAAQESGCFKEVYVCTDDEEIAELARSYKAKVPALIPKELAGPLVASHRPCQWLREYLNAEADILICLQPTSPLRTAEDIKAGIRRFCHGDVDSVVSVTPIDPHYFHWAITSGEKGYRLYFGEEFLLERPLLPPVFRPNGSIKIARFDSLKEYGHFFEGSIDIVETPEERSLHVATRFDLNICEYLLEQRTR